MTAHYGRTIAMCADGSTTGAHTEGRLPGNHQSRERGCERLERDGRGVAGRGQSSQAGVAANDPRCPRATDGSAGERMERVGDALPVPLRTHHKGTIRRNHKGYRMGEHHQKARLSDDDVRRMREMNARGIGYRRLRKLFGCGESTARDICTYRTRML